MSGYIVVDCGMGSRPARESGSARRIIECVLAPLSAKEGWDRENRSDTRYNSPRQWQEMSQ